MNKKKLVLNTQYIEAIKGYDENYRFSLESRLVDCDPDYIDCENSKEVIKELKNFVADKDFNAQDYECLAVLIYEAHSDYNNDDWGERVDEYYFV